MGLNSLKFIFLEKISFLTGRFSLRKYQLQASKINPRLVQKVLITTLFQLMIFPFGANASQQLIALVNDCRLTRSPEACMQALILIEDIQRKARFGGNYSCQTYALGLGADLIMMLENEDRTGSLTSMLQEVDKRCKTTEEASS